MPTYKETVNRRSANLHCSEFNQLLKFLTHFQPHITRIYTGTVKSAEDALHRNALLYTLRHNKLWNNRSPSHCALDTEDVEQYLLCKGCDPFKTSNDLFSWQTMERLMRIIEHYDEIQQPFHFISPASRHGA